jgi:hypothetical protein
VEAGAIIGGSAKDGLAKGVLLRELEVEFGLGITHLNAIMERLAVEGVQVSGSVLCPTDYGGEQQ